MLACKYLQCSGPYACQNTDHGQRGSTVEARGTDTGIYYLTVHAVWSIRIWPIRIKIFPVLNAYVVMTSSLLHKDTENLKKNKRFPTTEPFSDYPYRAYCMYGNENFGKFTRFPFMIRNFHQASLFSNFEVPWDVILGNLQGSHFMIWNFHQTSLVFQFWSDMGCDLANSQGSLFMIWNFHQASLVFQFWSDMGSDFWQTHKGPPFWFEIFTKLHFFLILKWHGMWFWPIHNHGGGFHYIEHTILFHETSLFLSV